MANETPTWPESAPLTRHPGEPLTIVEISRAAIRHNIAVLREASAEGGRQPLLCAMVKGNAYGHGLIPGSQELLAAGVDWLGTHDVSEIAALRQAGIAAPIYNVGYVAPWQVAAAVGHGARLVVYDSEVVQAAAAAARTLGTVARLHLKIETGNNRQGLRHDEAVELAARIASDPHLLLEGACTHFADVEDTTDHRFARSQLARFEAAVGAIRQRLQLPPAGHPDDKLLAHASNTAALLLWPEVCGGLVRFGIGAYGLWPSKETLLTANALGRKPLQLQPVLRWKTTVAQVRQVPAGEYVGYGRTFRAVRPMRVAVLPVGYYDGYDRRLSNLGKVLIGGQRAPVVGRVAMNITVVDVTDAPQVRAGDEAVLIGSQAAQDGEGDRISADEMAGWLGTIHYEVVTRIGGQVVRQVVA